MVSNFNNSGLERQDKTLGIHMHFCGFSQHYYTILLASFPGSPLAPMKNKKRFYFSSGRVESLGTRLLYYTILYYTIPYYTILYYILFSFHLGCDSEVMSTFFSTSLQLQAYDRQERRCQSPSTYYLQRKIGTIHWCVGVQSPTIRAARIGESLRCYAR